MSEQCACPEPLDDDAAGALGEPDDGWCWRCGLTLGEPEPEDEE